MRDLARLCSAEDFNVLLQPQEGSGNTECVVVEAMEQLPIKGACVHLVRTDEREAELQMKHVNEIINGCPHPAPRTPHPCTPKAPPPRSPVVCAPLLSSRPAG